MYKLNDDNYEVWYASAKTVRKLLKKVDKRLKAFEANGVLVEAGQIGIYHEGDNILYTMHLTVSHS